MQDPIKLSIDGLDPESCALLDIMWVMDSQEELELWKHCLPTKQKQKVETDEKPCGAYAGAEH